MDQKEQILAKIDLRQLIEEAGGQFNNQGDRATCPIHNGDNKNALSLYDDSQRWHSYTEGIGGDAFTFYMAWRRVNFKTALHDLAERADVSIAPTPPPIFRRNGQPLSEQYQCSLNNFISYAEEHLWDNKHNAIRQYLADCRGWDEATLLTWRIGYNPKCLWRPPHKWGQEKTAKIYLSKGVVYPHLHRDEIPFWANIRRPRPRDRMTDYTPPVKNLTRIKWTGIPNASRRLNGRHTHQDRDTIVLVEGEPDLVTAWQELHRAVDVATLGGANSRPTRADAIYLTRYKRVLAIYDPDLAGQQGLASLKETIGRIEPIPSPVNDGDLTDYFLQNGWGSLLSYLQKYL
jgi:DNA primase